MFWSKKKIKQELACGVIPVFQTSEGNKFLIVRNLSGNWGFPKGRIEPNESETECALRELREEVGITATIVENLSYEMEHFTTQTSFKTIKFFLGFIDLNKQPVKIQTTEVTEYKLVAVDELLSFFHFDNLRELTKKVLLDLSNK